MIRVLEILIWSGFDHHSEFFKLEQFQVLSFAVLDM